MENENQGDCNEYGKDEIVNGLVKIVPAVQEVPRGGQHYDCCAASRQFLRMFHDLPHFYLRKS